MFKVLPGRRVEFTNFTTSEDPVVSEVRLLPGRRLLLRSTEKKSETVLQRIDD